MDEYPSVPSATARLSGRALGIDIGGTGSKAAVVDVGSGQLVSERVRELTPRPATVDAVLDVVDRVVRRLEATGTLTRDMPGESVSRRSSAGARQ
jgi:predicted NBD/HSP70 family sugar kinase